MDVSVTNVVSMSESELRELIQSAQEALERLVAKRARSTLKEARRLAAEVGFEVAFSKTGRRSGAKTKPGARRYVEKPPSARGKVLPKYRNPENPEETWSGRGRSPKWVQAAVAEGRTLADLAIPVEGAPARA